MLTPSDHVYVAHDPKRAGEVYNRAWSEKERQTARVWKRAADSGQHIDITTQVDRVTVSQESIVIEGRGQRYRVKPGREHTRGMAQGTVHAVEPIA